ncbi:hypothetical protein GCM10022198_19260 [Klugiella xanthotipulae]|uniref:Uncharacterized protein n=1 Tax=Klugiella xanthotipulae TaxID=244735 RepID=A0A543HS09_9MICO|nr:hypothetical protein [Klugiella xanthotipulae]TQM61126.1 hypothetical protein FB466_2057 [Klugiella xanthotipulae]
MSEPEQQSERRQPSPSRGQLSDIMFTFDICMQQIGITFMDHVHLSYEDPETFGGGHCLMENNSPGMARE